MPKCELMAGEANTVQEQLAPVATLLSEYALLISQEAEQHGVIPAADSRVMAELAEEHRFGSPRVGGAGTQRPQLRADPDR